MLEIEKNLKSLASLSKIKNSFLKLPIINREIFDFFDKTLNKNLKLNNSQFQKRFLIFNRVASDFNSQSNFKVTRDHFPFFLYYLT
jgi:hypothetical protein